MTELSIGWNFLSFFNSLFDYGKGLADKVDFHVVV